MKTLTKTQVEAFVVEHKDQLPLRYRKRACYFTNYKDSCGFNPLTGNGHSYSWYALTKVIKGQLVLNSYGYSNQTAKHVSKMRRLFGLMELDFIELPAPRGLQDLDACRNHILKLYGDAMIADKYARKHWHWALEQVSKYMLTARTLGLTFSAKARKQAEADAEVRRRSKLDRQKLERQRRKEYLAQRERDRAELERKQAPALTLIQGGAQ